MNRTIRWGLSKGFRLAVAVGILYYLFTQASFFNVMTAIASAKFNDLIAAMILSLLSVFAAAYRLRFLTNAQGMFLSTSQVLEINLATIFYGLFLPGGNLTGGAIRLYKLSKADRKLSEALASLVFDRMAATIALAAVGLFFWWVDPVSHLRYVGLIMTAFLVGLILLHILLFGRVVPLSLEKALEWIKPWWLLHKADTLLQSLGRYRDISNGSLAFVFFLSIASQLLGSLVYYALAMSLGMKISFVAVTWIRCAVMMITLLPISISGIGIREGGLLFLLGAYGISGEEALAFSFLVFGTTLLWTGAIGGLMEGWRFLLPTVRHGFLDEKKT